MQNNTDYWNAFWNNYRKKEVQSNDDLYFQVGKTIDKKPIGRAAFNKIIQDISEKLNLQPTDTLIDLCCGNGLVTFELAHLVEKILAVDFADHLIATARVKRHHENITYLQSDALTGLKNIFEREHSCSIKILINDALAYFELEDLNAILQLVRTKKQNRSILLLATNIPDDNRKWNFYNTPERKEKYLSNLEDSVKDGMGRWWRRDEIEAVCLENKLACSIVNQDHILSDYRMDLLVSF